MLRTQSVTNKQKETYTTLSHIQHCTIFTKLRTVIELVVPIKKGPFVFGSNAQFFLQGARKNLAELTDALFLSNNSVICEANHVKFETLT